MRSRKISDEIERKKAENVLFRFATRIKFSQNISK